MKKKPFIHKGLAVLTHVIFILVVSSSWAVSSNIGGVRVEVPLKTAKDLRDRNINKQAYDFSCGSASLATLLTYGFGEEITEDKVLFQILSTLSTDAENLRKKEGVNLLDLKRVAEGIGCRAQGFKIKPENLTVLKIPVIVFIKPRDYAHFSVLKGIERDRVYLADPSSGNIRMPLYKFLDIWIHEDGKGIIFTVENAESSSGNPQLLKAPETNLTHPEILTAREMMEVGDPQIHFQFLRR